MMQDKTVVLNAARVNYDGKAGFEKIASQVTVYDDTPPEKMLERVDGYTVVVTKEIRCRGS